MEKSRFNSSQPLHLIVLLTLATGRYQSSLGAGLDHFDVAPVATRQYAGLDLPLTIIAMDALGNVVSNFTGTVSLRGETPEVPSYLFGFEEGVNRPGNTSPWTCSFPNYGRYEVRNMDVDGDGSNSLATCAAINNGAPYGSDSITRSVPLRGGVIYQVQIDAALENDGSTPFTPSFNPYTILVANAVQLAGITYMYSGTLNPHALARITSSGWYTPDNDGSYSVGITIYPGVQTNASIWECFDNLEIYPILVWPETAANFTNGVWTGAVTLRNAASNQVVRVTDGAGHTGASNPFDVFARQPMTLSLPAGTEGDGIAPAEITIPTPAAVATVITLASADTTELLVPPEVLLPAGQTSVVFNLTIVDDAELDGDQQVMISATSAPYYNNGQWTFVYDNESAILNLTLPASISEGAGTLSNAGMLTSSEPPTANISVHLSSSDTTELSVPSTVTLPAGQTNVAFNITAVNDTILDGPQPVTVTASVPNWTSGTATLVVEDNETTNLTLRISLGKLGQDQTVALWETQASFSNNEVRVSFILPTNLIVALVSTNAELATVSPSVTIPAGANYANFTLNTVDDSLTNGTRLTAIVASAPGFGSAWTNLTVLDDELEHFSFGTLSGARTCAVPFAVTIQAKSIDNLTLPLNFPSGLVPLWLTASGDRGPVAVLAPTNFTLIRGQWSGSVTLGNPDTNVRLRIADPAGHAGLSDPIELAPATFVDSNSNGLPDDWEMANFGSLNSPDGDPAFDFDGDGMPNGAEYIAGTSPIDPASVFRIQGVHINGQDCAIDLPTVTGRRYQGQTASSLAGPWSAGGQAVLGTGAGVTLHLPAPSTAAGFFYRVEVFP